MLIIFYSLLMLRVGRCTDTPISETKAVHVGDNVSLTCTREASGSLFWFKVVSENFPKVFRTTSSFEIDGDRIRTKAEPGTFVLYITRARLSDTAFYYCMKTLQQKLIFLKGTYLKVEGPEPATTAVPQAHPVRPEDSVTLQCSVLHDSQNKTSPADDGVFCFNAESHQSHPSFNYTQVNGGDEYEKDSEGKKCFYTYFKNLSSSDAGTYYCAVATYGKISFGNKSKLDTEAVSRWDSKTDNTILYLLCAALAISLTVIAFLVYLIKKLKEKDGYCHAAVAVQTNAPASGDQENQQTDEDSVVYSSVTFACRKSSKTRTSDSKPAEEESIYTDVRTGLTDL